VKTGYVNIADLAEIDADIVYAVGDVHGKVDLVRAIEALIHEDIASSTASCPTICYLGDYIDRGPDSAEVIDWLSTRSGDGVERVFLKGNHEDRMLDFFDSPAEKGPAWMEFGGRDALASYGVDLSDLAIPDWPTIAKELAEKLPTHHWSFLQSLKLGARWGDYLFVHAGLNPDEPISRQPSHDLMWIREPFLSSSTDWGMQVVHGHVIVEEPAYRANRIGIDTGAYKTGVLTCLVLDEGGRRLLQTSGAA
jgi:serine/threonine protein phosphatase 1